MLSGQRRVGLLDVVSGEVTSPSVDLFVLTPESAILKGSSALDAPTSGSVDRFLSSPAKNNQAETGPSSVSQWSTGRCSGSRGQRLR